MEDQLWARAAVGGDGALSEQEECRGQASRLSPHNGRNGGCDLCFSWLKVPVDPGGAGGCSACQDFFDSTFSVGQVGGQMLLGCDLFPSEETWLGSSAALKCLHMCRWKTGQRASVTSKI